MILASAFGLGLGRPTARPGVPVDGMYGFPVRLGDVDGGIWAWDADAGVPRRSVPRTDRPELEVCASCHARRAPLVDGFTPGVPFLDQFLPGFDPRAWAAGPVGPTDGILLVIGMYGGNDGLNTVVPRRQDEYFRLRPTLALPPTGVHALDDDFGLHPRMGGLAGLFEEGRLAVVHGVGHAEAVVAQRLGHEPGEEPGHRARPHGAPGLAREAEARQRGGNHVKGVVRTAAEAFGMGQRFDDFSELRDGARPAMADEQRQGRRTAALFADEMDVDVVDRRGEVSKAVELFLLPAPVELVQPVG